MRLLLAATLLLAACAPKDQPAPPADTTAVAPAATDSAMPMTGDSVMARDTAKP